MMKATEYIGLMTHALGKTPDVRHDLWHAFNRAGRALFTRRDWSWRAQGPVTIAAVAARDYLLLPEDFGGVTEAWVPNSASAQYLRLVSLAEIANLRATIGSTIAAGQYAVYFPMWNGQASAEEQPTRRALVFPTPTTAGSPTMSMTYRRRWVEIASNDGERVPNIPLEFEHALILQSRAYAIAIENQTPPFEDGPLAAEYERLWTEDITAQTDLGKVRGGADRFFNRGGYRAGGRYPARASL